METKINTPLAIDEIDFRVQSINKGGYATILAYKDARVDMNRLDAVYGSENWQKRYQSLNGNLFCSVGIFNKDLKEWIWKEDVGTESNTEKEKGQASDAFKRACFNLGIGRELYDYPVIQIKLDADEFELKSEKAYPTFKFQLKKWTWFSTFNEGKLLNLKAVDNNGKLRFEYSVGAKQLEPKQTAVIDVPRLETRLKACGDVTALETVYKSLTPEEQKAVAKLTTELKLKLTNN